MSSFGGFIEGSNTTLAHYGIVAGAFDELGIGELIDELLPKKKAHVVTHGQSVKSLVINGLAFIDRRLYLHPIFYEDVPTERIFGEGIHPEHFSDDTLGRTLDRIYEYGPTELFNQIVIKRLMKHDYGIHCVHVDTTNFSVYGDYDSECDSRKMDITFGHPKDGRTDLKRFVLGMAVDQRGVPLFLQTFSGNESDKKTIVEMIGNLRNNLISPHKVYHLADNAFYTQPNLQEMGDHTLWISRVTNSIKQAKELLATDLPLHPCSDTQYSYIETTSSFAGIQQKWVLYHSNEMQPKKLKTYERNLVKDQEKKIKSLKSLKSREFACENDALAEAENWISKKKKYKFSLLEIYAVSKRSEGKRGRPKKDEILLKKYKIKAEIELNLDVIEEEKKKLGRFILATNDETLDSDTLLTEYKNQYKVERGFRFLKDKSFRIGEVFLKKESRIQALAMIMVLCLFVYSLVEFELRKKLKESNETVTSQTNKQTEKPTLKWVFFGFRRVREQRFLVNGEMIITLTNMQEELWKVLRLLGKDYEKYYA